LIQGVTPLLCEAEKCHKSDLKAIGKRNNKLTATLQRIKDVVGPAGWIAYPQHQEPYLVKAGRLYGGAASASGSVRGHSPIAC
jgi:hypothetical protein